MRFSVEVLSPFSNKPRPQLRLAFIDPNLISLHSEKEGLMKRLSWRTYVFIIHVFWLSVIARPAVATTTILSDAANLGVAVAAASNGDTIEIDSNSVYSGILTWSNKFITIQAGNGYFPTVSSIQNIYGNSTTGGDIRGLKIVGPVSINGGGTTFSNLNFYDNTISSDVNFNGVGEWAIHSTMQNNHLKNVYFDGTGNLTGNVKLDGNTVSGDVSAGVVGQAHYDLNIMHNVVQGGIASGQGITSVIDSNFARHGIGGGSDFDYPATMTVTRNVLMDELSVEFGANSSVNVNASNNVIVKASDSRWPAGIRVAEVINAANSNTKLTFVNNTVVGFDSGISVENVHRSDPTRQFSMSFTNMLLQNGLDTSGLLSSEIKSSLIADGTYSGINGNFGGIPNLGPNGELLAGSIGIDKGDNAAASMLATDIVGNPRILDGNHDGTARVDVGAYELVVAEPRSFVGFVVGGALCFWMALSSRRLDGSEKQ
jgi:hypothetical protein